MLVSSTMLDLGTKASDFTLSDPDGKKWSLSECKGENGFLVAFICNHCPFVIHLKEALNVYAMDYKQKGINVVAINSNDMDAYPADNLEAMKVDSEEHNYIFPYLADMDQSIAKAYKAICTPDFYLFDNNAKLVYRGQFDRSRPNQGEATGDTIRQATDQLLAGEDPLTTQLPSMGCNIKWIQGQEPDYFG